MGFAFSATCCCGVSGTTLCPCCNNHSTPSGWSITVGKLVDYPAGNVTVEQGCVVAKEGEDDTDYVGCADMNDGVYIFDLSDPDAYYDQLDPPTDPIGGCTWNWTFKTTGDVAPCNYCEDVSISIGITCHPVPTADWPGAPPPSALINVSLGASGPEDPGCTETYSYQVGHWRKVQPDDDVTNQGRIDNNPKWSYHVGIYGLAAIDCTQTIEDICTNTEPYGTLKSVYTQGAGGCYSTGCAEASPFFGNVPESFPDD